MKSVKTLVKNLKILSRSKGSALMILLAPLLIVLIIGFSFAGKVENKTDIGIYLNENSNELTNRFVANLNSTENSLSFFPSSQGCIDAIKQSVVVTCIIFPQDFSLADNKTNEVTFFVDESRMNLVYQLISSLTLNVNVESGEVSKEITERLLLIMEEAKSTMNTGVSTTVGMKAKLKSVEGKESEIKNKVSAMDVSAESVDIGGSSEELADVALDVKDLRSDAQTVVSRGYALIAAYPNISYSNLELSLIDLNKSINESQLSLANLDLIIESLDAASEQISEMESKLATAQEMKTTVATNIDRIDADIKSLISDVDQLKSKQEAVLARINSFTFRSADSITNPITTKIESVVAKNNKITYFFPYLLMLVVLFVGIMLSSTLVFMEKDSRAFFRNFTTPTKNAHFIIMTYLTSLLILVIQSAVVLVAVYYGLQVPILNNLGVTLIFLFLGLTVFILLGMVLGNIFSTSEAITMSTITVGSVFIFLSNLVLPLETLSPVIAKIAAYNPYVIVSESIRKSMLMGISLQGLYYPLAILGIYVVGLLILVISIKKVITTKLFEKILRRKVKHVVTVPEDHYLNIPEKNVVIRNIPELLDFFKNLSSTDYKNLTVSTNIFSKWLKDNLNERRLASKIEKKSLEKSISILESHLGRK
jgi:ABC-type multidrug transport system permease subunit